MRFLVGDATDPVGDGPRIIAHICNDKGAWGKGFVLALSRRWPAPEREYRVWFGNPSFGLGRHQLVWVAPDLWVANMVAQRGLVWVGGEPPIRYRALEGCLEAVAAHARTLGASVHMPRIGCGLAGGRWNRIEPIIERTLGARGVEVVVYDLEQR